MTNKNSVNTNAEILFAAMTENLGTDDAETIAEDLKMTSAAYLEEKYPGKFDGWSKGDLHAAIITLLRKLDPNDGIEFAGRGSADDAAIWLAATLVESGRLPSQKQEQRRWIRLDTITSVYANNNIGVGNDPRDWQFSVTVRADGVDYHASPLLFRGEMVNAAVDKVLNAVARILRAG